MIKTFTILIMLFVCLFLTAQEKVTTNQWQKDLLFLQNTVHKNYNFLFVKIDKEAFDSEVEKLYNEIPNLREHEIVVGMSKIVSLFKYGHTGIFLEGRSSFHHLPFNLYEFTDGVFIQGTTKKYKKALGAKVLKVNNMTIEHALEKIQPVVNSENSQYFKAYGINHLVILEVLHAQKITKELQSSVTLTLEKDGKTFTQTFESLPKGKSVPTKYGFVSDNEEWLGARDESKTPLFLKNLDKVYFYEYLPKEKAVYVRHSRIANDKTEDTETFYNRVFDFIEKNQVEKLVLDVRLNGGGNNYLNKPIITNIIKSEKINKIGSLYVIIGRRTFSASQNLVNEIDNYTNALFVGEPTAENINFWGDTNTVILPNSKIKAYLSYAWWQDKPAWENADWTAPQIPVGISSTEYITNQDPILTAALNFSGENFKPNPMDYIRKLFMEGNMQKLAMETSKMVKDPRYKFFNFEEELSKSGKRFLEINPQTAVQILSFVSQLFPKSPSAIKNLAEGYLKMGDKVKASELLNKVIAMDKGGQNGKNAKDLLESIN
ncbi:hypothetical protein [Tenacibaculum sp. M341]|uniref:hypothetical protein n=1 Tax=Tenacibaculum sp. M341 TaxID=2530339 RepID=UPI001051DC60|nr:hypothetical protein [Tenacibaculum sp. M341]TCI84813.1 hypothetical protein EYW44_19520 [Tenacibaculum sp. M341]